MESILVNITFSFVVSLTTASQSLRHILASFPSEGISFRRDLETQPFVFDKLPDEIIIAILQSFVDTADTRSVERFANVSRKARLVTLEPSLWRYVSLRKFGASSRLSLTSHR